MNATTNTAATLTAFQRLLEAVNGNVDELVTDLLDMGCNPHLVETTANAYRAAHTA